MTGKLSRDRLRKKLQLCCPWAYYPFVVTVDFLPHAASRGHCVVSTVCPVTVRESASSPREVWEGLAKIPMQEDGWIFQSTVRGYGTRSCWSLVKKNKIKYLFCTKTWLITIRLWNQCSLYLKSMSKIKVRAKWRRKTLSATLHPIVFYFQMNSGSRVPSS